MSDEGLDPCECIWYHELAMQRLLSILRQSQSYCTDTECFSLSRLPGPRDVSSSCDLLMPMLIIVFTMLMIALGPRGLRFRSVRPDGAKSGSNGSSDSSNGDPPTPPPTVN